MEKLLLTQLSLEEFRQIIREELKFAIQELKKSEEIEPQEEILDMEAAAKFLRLSKSYLYKLTSSMEIPRFKRGKRLYFKRSELIEWISEGRLKTMKDIEAEALDYINKN